MSDLMRVIAVLRPGINCADIDGTVAGMRWDAPLPEGFSPPSQNEVDVAIARANKLAGAIAAFDARVATGLAYGGKVLQIRDADRSNITGKSLEASLCLNPASGLEWDAGMYWRTADDTPLLLPTPQDMIAMAAAVSQRYTALRLRLGALKDAINGAQDVQTLGAIDVDDGWS